MEAAQDRLEHVKDTWKRFRKSQHKRMNKLVLQKEMDAITVDKSFQKWMVRCMLQCCMDSVCCTAWECTAW